MQRFEQSENKRLRISKMTSVSKVGNSMTYSYGGPSGYTPQSGAGVMGDILKGAKTVAKVVKDNKLLSKAAAVGQFAGIPGSQQLKQVAKMTGTGKKRKSKK